MSYFKYIIKNRSAFILIKIQISRVEFNNCLNRTNKLNQLNRKIITKI